MVNSNIFDYINVLDKAADASWLRNEAISNNIANVDTPNYKRQDVAFETELKRALNTTKYDTMDARVYNLNLNRIQPEVYTDAQAYSYRLDGNNVDIDTENEGTKKRSPIWDSVSYRCQPWLSINISVSFTQNLTLF